MSTMRTELPNNTAEQVRSYVQAALDLVAELDPPADLRASVFEQACGLIAGKQIMLAQPMPAVPILDGRLGR